MKIKLNNCEIETTDECNLQSVLDQSGYLTGNFAVALNGKFIPKASYQHCSIQAGDEVILIQPMQGG